MYKVLCRGIQNITSAAASPWVTRLGCLMMLISAAKSHGEVVYFLATAITWPIPGAQLGAQHLQHIYLSS